MAEQSPGPPSGLAMTSNAAHLISSDLLAAAAAGMHAALWGGGSPRCGVLRHYS